VVTDTLPGGVTFVSTNGCGEDPNGVPTCSLGTIPAGGQAQYTIIVTVNGGASGTITNSASVSSSTVDPNLANNTVTEDTAVNPSVVPTVIDVLLSGMGWNPLLPAFSLFTGLNPTDPLPWVNMNTIEVVFDEDVDVVANSLTLVGVNIPNYFPPDPGVTFGYNNTTFTATWKFPSFFGTDKFLINLAGEASDSDPIRAAGGGVLLNGGSDSNHRYDVLKGDANRNGSTTVTDLVNIGSRVVSVIGDAIYTQFFDVNGSGSITVTDLVNTGAQVVSVLPPGNPIVPPLLAAGGQGPGGSELATLTDSDLASVAQSAIERWAVTGISELQLQRLEQVTFTVSDLDDGILGNATGSDVTIDINGAGYGWFIDDTPGEDTEFGHDLHALAPSEAHGRMDLLTVVMHELGHVLGRRHDQDDNPGVMDEELAISQRLLPEFVADRDSSVDEVFREVGLDIWPVVLRLI
jgi:hypothetical protein